MAGIEIARLSKHFLLQGQVLAVIRDLSLSIADQSFVTILGRSGCGKTTLLRLICGLEAIDAGTLNFTKEGRQCPREKTRVSIVFQEPRLMPWLTVKQNLALALHAEKDRARVDNAVGGCLHMLGLDAFTDAYPHQLSGGMAQRVALGRTLCYDPDVILMDEPFGALDAFTRRRLQAELTAIFITRKKTVVFVTHDVEEALSWGQRVLVLDAGRLVLDLVVTLPYPRDPPMEPFFQLRRQLLDAVCNHAEQGQCAPN